MKVVEGPIAPKVHGQRSVGFAGPVEPRVAVRSWDMVTAFGDTSETWRALLSGASVSNHVRCEVTRAPRESRARALARRALDQTDLHLDRDVAVVVGTSKGSVESWIEGEVSPPALGDIAEHIGDLTGTRGPRLTVSAACASGLHALIRGAMMIRHGDARQVLVVAAEASVHPLFLASFQRLGVLATSGAGCRPFDRKRSGFLMSEAAAAVVLEAEQNGHDSPDDGVYIDRFAIGGDATHLTGGDPGLRTLRHLLARVIDSPVDLVHAHGTGTEANDEAELAAIESAIDEQATPPVLYSHKGALGHSLGASGLLSVVINCQAHASGAIPPNGQTRDPLPTTRVLLSSRALRRGIRRSVAIAAGFGGATAVVSLVSE